MTRVPYSFIISCAAAICVLLIWGCQTEPRLVGSEGSRSISSQAMANKDFTTNAGQNEIAETQVQETDVMRQQPVPPSNDAVADPVGFDPAPVVPLSSQPPARIVVDAPIPEQLAVGRVVVRYRTENLRIVQVFGPAALSVSPRIGHLHVTVDDAPWHWLDASGEPLIINGLPAGRHKLLVELADPNHKVIDRMTIGFDVPQRPIPYR